ncbi:cohesin domain-containing protein [Vallitalea guaymasensis]|uniref:Cohesin domain-containing protein n=1 Tax=Vallitalea guaymasensis TaxID=1185412 RepID=A0A8J8M7U3_9FIRM|nr:cohesin domain-containing protein [Vallitalea guaymasensis]QUH27916.1 hypothetical protein HYG85_02895 [Vallitalea guaymasensis]
MKKFRIMLVVVILLFVCNINLYAASLGSKLLTPTEGWKRVNDSDSRISYIGELYYTNWSHGTVYDGDIHGQTSPDQQQICFNFTGTKIRTYGVGYSGMNNGNMIIIDGVEYEMANWSQLPNNDMGLTFEKTDLEDKEHYVKIVGNGSERMYFDCVDIDENAQLKSYNENVIIEPSLDIESVSKIKEGQELVADIVIHNVSDIYAEDIKIKYDANLFQYVGYENVEGLEVYNSPEDKNGELRFIIASKGKENVAKDNTIIIKLNFKATKAGEGLIDITQGHIANINEEFDIEEKKCGEKNIIIEEVKDVNLNGEFTLIDLAIDGYYYGMSAADTNTTKYHADVDDNGDIQDVDLKLIVCELLSNSNYEPNN